MLVRSMLVATVVVAAAATSALAQSASVQAQSLFDQGRALIKAGKIAEACTAFESSQKLDPVVTTLLNLAECRERNRQLATAWGAFVDANRMARANNNEKLARVATNHARKLEPRLSRLTIAVAADRHVHGLEVVRDKELVNPASWNHALPIDGGTYTITARAPGRVPWSVTRTIKIESDAQVIEIPKLAELAAPVAPTAARPPAKTPAAPSAAPGATPPAAAAAPTTAPAAAPKTAPQTAKAPATSPPQSSPTPPATSARPAPGPSAVATTRPGGERPATAQTETPPKTSPPPAMAQPVQPSNSTPVDEPRAAQSLLWPGVFGAGALALGGIGIAFEVKGRSAYNEAKDITELSREMERESLVRTANSRHKTAQWLGLAALGSAGVAIYLYVRDRGESHSSASAIAPVVSPELAGVAFAARW